MTKVFLFSCGALFVLAAAGCGGGDKSLSEDQFCVEWAKNECSKVAPKCVFDNAKCEVDQKMACQKFATAAKATSAKREYRPANSGRCLSAISSVYGSAMIMASDLANQREACERVFQGEAKANETCVVDFDCEKSLVCDKSICAAKKTVGAGANCGNPGEYCPVGQYCAKPMTVFVCAARQGLDKACGADLPCQEKYRCSAGLCKEQFEMSLACTSNQDCKSGLCDPYSHVCVPFVSFALGSASCKALVGMAPDAPPASDAAAVTPDAGVARDTGVAAADSSAD